MVFVGPNNSGKSSALQALALWSVGVRRWVERHGDGDAPQKRPGATINRRDLIALPTPSADLLWRNLRVREGEKVNGKQHVRNVLVDIVVEGIDEGRAWRSALEFDYANPESFYCRSKIDDGGKRSAIPAAASSLKIAYLPPMSGLASNEVRLDQGAIDVRIGEGRTADVLRNLCWIVRERTPGDWEIIVDEMQRLFGVKIEEPTYVKERGEIVMAYKAAGGVELDISASGRGQQQTLLLLAHLAANPRSVLLLDEPDAHLEFLRQRQIYQVLADAAARASSQIIAASHSEVLLNEACDRDIVIAFVGQPHRIDDRGTKAQVAKALKEIGFEQYLQAEQRGWVLYLEGATDLAVLKSLARSLDHPAAEHLENAFVHYVANQPGKARDHFFGLREAIPDLAGLAIFDRLDGGIKENAELAQMMWSRREIENYLCHERALLDFAEDQGRRLEGDLFATAWRDRMREAIEEVANAVRILGDDPWGPDIKASDRFLTPLFAKFYEKCGLDDLMRKTDFHTLAPFVPRESIDRDVCAALDAVEFAAKSASIRSSP